MPPYSSRGTPTLVRVCTTSFPNKGAHHGRMKAHWSSRSGAVARLELLVVPVQIRNHTLYETIQYLLPRYTFQTIFIHSVTLHQKLFNNALSEINYSGYTPKKRAIIAAIPSAPPWNKQSAAWKMNRGCWIASALATRQRRARFPASACSPPDRLRISLRCNATPFAASRRERTGFSTTSQQAQQSDQRLFLAPVVAGLRL